MARINIDIGTLGNPATGDTLRGAMQKINTNFTEVYSLVRDGSSGLIATDVTNGDLKIQANGTGSIEIDTLSIQNSTITSIGTNSDITITPNGTGNVVLGNFTFNADQTVGASEDNYVFVYDHSTGTIGLEASAAGDVTASSTTTFTNKTFDVEGTGNSISNIDVADFKAAAIVTEAEGIGSNDNDTTLPTSAAVKDYVDARDIGDLSVVGSTISAPSNADLTLTTSGTGSVSIDGIQVSGTEISSTDSTQITIKENLHVTGTITGDGSGLTGVVASGISSPATIDNITLNDNIISTSSNANLNLNPGGTGTVELQANTNIDGDATATTFIGDLRGPTVFQAKATEDISKGEAVYISGLSGNTPEVALARANSASTMPAFGIAAADIANTATGNIVTFGSCPSHDVADFGETSITFALGDTVYISSAEAGKLTNVAPTGESNLIQNIGKIERATPTTNMTIKVGGAGRTNATPALDNGNIFIGNGSNQSSTVALGTQIKSYTGLTVVGDDSSGTGFNIGETIKVAGATGITTAVSGDTLTITGPDLSSYLTNSTTTIVGDDSSGTTINSGETFKFAGATGVTTAVSGDTLTITGPDLTSFITASSSTTFTNKTFDVEGTGNSISNIDVADFKAAAIVIESEGIGSNDNDTTLPTSAAVKDYVDTEVSGVSGASTGDITFTGSTIISPSNADITLDPSGTGGVVAQGPVTFNAGYIEKINTLTSSSTITVDCSAASIHTVTLGTSTEFNISNLPTGGSVTLIITQDGSGNRTATFGTDGSSAVKFPSNSSTLSTGSGDIDVVTIVNDGTNFLGNIAKDYRSS